MTLKSSETTESQAETLRITKLQLARTRRVNSALWARVNFGALRRDENGQMISNDAENRLALLESENIELTRQLEDLSQKFEDVSRTNAELWKRVHYAEARAGLPLRRMAGKVLRRVGLRR